MILESKLIDAPPLTYNYCIFKKVINTVALCNGGTFIIDNMIVAYCGRQNLLLYVIYDDIKYTIFF